MDRSDLARDVYSLAFDLEQRRSINKSSREEAYKDFIMHVFQEEFLNSERLFQVLKESKEISFYLLRNFDCQNPMEFWGEIDCIMGTLDSLEKINIILDGVEETTVAKITMSSEEIEQSLLSDYEITNLPYYKQEKERYFEIEYLSFVDFLLFDPEFEDLRTEQLKGGDSKVRPEYYIILKKFMKETIKWFKGVSLLPITIKSYWFEINLLSLSKYLGKSIPSDILNKLAPHLEAPFYYYENLSDVSDLLIELVFEAIDLKQDQILQLG